MKPNRTNQGLRTELISLTFVSLLTGVALGACSSDEQAPGGDSESVMGSGGGNGLGGAGSGGGPGSAAGGSGASTGSGSSTGAGGNGGPSWPTGGIRPTRYRVPEPVVASEPCINNGSGTLAAQQILLGQTHLTPEGWPLQTISAARPLTVAVLASGTGEAPAMTATARLDDEEETICLSGSATLPSDTANQETSTYRGSFPSKWVQPGVQIEVTVGGVTSSVEVNVVAENGMTLYLVEAELFSQGSNDETTDAQLVEFAARLPFSYLDVGYNPFGVWRPTRLLLDPRDDGKTPTGGDAPHPALIVDESPHCTSDEATAGTCTAHSGYGTMAAVLGALDVFREANGATSNSTWYADLGEKLGGGLAGGQRGTGDDTGLTMNHELGHAWGFPHWGSSHVDYPYEGVQRDRGGFGDMWGLDQVTGLLLSPQCDDLERQSPMQRSGSCVPEGSWFDPYSDYESARLLRMLLGASDPQSGEVAYSGGTAGGATRPYTLPSEGGRELMLWDPEGPGFTLARYDEATKQYAPYLSDRWNKIAQAEVPVVMFTGALIMGEDSFFEEPISYVGNVLEHLDPSDPDDYAVIYDRRASDFYWAKDLNFRFTLDDGTVFARLFGGEAVLRAAGDRARFAFNLPADVGEKVVKCEVLSRPLGQYEVESRLDETDSAANYYDAATVLATWEK